MERSPGGLPLAAVMGRVPQEPWDARPITMATAAPEKPEVGVWNSPSPMQMRPGREEASWAACPPTQLCHLIPLFTKAEQYPRPSLKGRRWGGPQGSGRSIGGNGEGDHYQCPPPILLHWVERARDGGEVGTKPLSTPPSGGHASLPGVLWLWAALPHIRG